MDENPIPHRGHLIPGAAACQSMGNYNVQEGNGAPEEIRTPNLLIRSQMLYPIELRARSWRSVEAWTTGAAIAPPEKRAGRSRGGGT